MLEILKPYWLKILQWVGALGGIVLLLLQVRKSGEETIKQQNAEATLKAVTERDKIESNINNLNDIDLNKLYNKQVKRD